MMSDPSKTSSEKSTPSGGSEAATHVVDLLVHYSFDLGGKRAKQLVDFWQSQYSSNWVRWAVIEALYQGRYKAISVEQILQLWQRREQPCYHFNYEFERLVCNKFPRNLAQLTQPNRSQLTPDVASLPSIPSPTQTLREALASPPTSASEVLPAWAELAEQIQKVPEEAEPAQKIQPVDRIEPPEILLDRVARLQAGVDALIEQATSSLNASNEAMKTKWHTGEAKSSTNGQSTAAPEALPELSEDVHPPIHQFMPTSTETEFHSKLKAVVEQEEPISKEDSGSLMGND